MIRAEIWDTVGDERFKSISNIYLEGAVGSLIYYDGTNPQLFSNLKDWLDQLRNVANEDIVIICVSDKTDLAKISIV